MEELINTPSTKFQTVRLKPIALPAEHGGWGMLAEPIILGLLIAPTIGGGFISLAAVAAFLTRQPLKIALGAFRSDRKSPRTALAWRFVYLYLSLALIAFVAAIASTPITFLPPLVIASPFAIVQVIYDARGRSRALMPEICGAVGISSVVTAIALAGGTAKPIAFVLWVLLVARVIPTILYLRVRLQRLHGKSASTFVPLAAHVIAVVLGLGLFQIGISSLLSVAALLMLLMRALFGLFSRETVRAKTLGIRELIFGALFVLAVFAGATLGW